MRPHFVDNQQGNTLAAALSGYWKHLQQQGHPVEELCIASGFFNLGGFRLLAPVLEQVPRVRLLLGVEPRPEAERPEADPGQLEQELWQELLREQLKELQRGLRRQRDLLPFDREEDQWVRRLLQLLHSGRIEVRQCQERILHAKAYLFRTREAGVLVGSSNLTWGGLYSNLELNLGHYDPELVERVSRWFDELWQQAEPFDLAGIYDRLMEEYPPFWIYLRVLYELYGEQLAQEEQEAPIRLTEFQKHGVWRALRIMEQHGGVLVADSVGLGKTYVAGEIARRFIQNRQRVLLICPAALRDNTWEDFWDKHQLHVEMLSYEQLGEEDQLGGRREYLKHPVEEYALVIIDEAHHYRNPGTPKRAVVLQRLLRKARYPKVLLLSATPVNNSLWDLYYLIRYFLRQDAALAHRGVLSVRDRFVAAMNQDPFNLEPDLLYPVLDATVVKRTRGFINREYPNVQIQLDDGRRVLIRFPRPVLHTVRYPSPGWMRKLLGDLEQALAPEDGMPEMSLARYQPRLYLKPQYREADSPDENPVVGLLRSGLLKRFESSVHAFRCTVKRMLDEHDAFLQGLRQGRVLGKEAVKEISATGDEVDDESLQELIADAPAEPASRYDRRELQQAVQADRELLQRWLRRLERVRPENDPKLEKLAELLAEIAARAEEEAVDEQDERRKRKVIIFSAFEDTLEWIEQFLQRRLREDPRLAAYRGRMVSVSGDGSRGGISRDQAISGFAPSASGEPETEDRFDLLLSTDVISEGMNLQDCRNIINFDLPWNPMRLVQRHGRVDRITSPHDEIHLMSFFPNDELKRLLDLDERIRRELAQAAASVGVETPPLADSPQVERSFSESRREIEQILQEDPTLFEEGGRPSAALSSEEHRAVLRRALEKYREDILELPWKAGSGMRTSGPSGFFFLARVGLREKNKKYFMRFVPRHGGELVGEEGTCLRLIQCEESTPRELPDAMRLEAYEAWQRARASIWQQWQELTDPANLQPRLRPLNRKVAEFLRTTPPPGMPQHEVDELLERVLSPWSLAVERDIRSVFEDPDLGELEKAKQIADKIDYWGIEPCQVPEPLPPIRQEEIRLICWLALVGEQ